MPIRALLCRHVLCIVCYIVTLSHLYLLPFHFLHLVIIHHIISSPIITISKIKNRVPADNEILADFYELGEDFGDIVDCGDLGEVFTVLSENKKKSSESQNGDSHRETKIVNKFSLEDMVESNRFESEKLEKGNFMTIKQQNQLKIMRTEEEDTVKTLKERKSYVKKSRKLTSQRTDPGSKKRNFQKELSPARSSRTNSISKMSVFSTSPERVKRTNRNGAGKGGGEDGGEGGGGGDENSNKRMNMTIDMNNINNNDDNKNGISNKYGENGENEGHAGEVEEGEENTQSTSSPCNIVPLNYPASLRTFDDLNDEDSTDSEAEQRPSSTSTSTSQNVPHAKADLPNIPLTAMLGTTNNSSSSSSGGGKKVVHDTSDDVIPTIGAYWNEDPGSMDVTHDVTHHEKQSSVGGSMTDQALQLSDGETVCVDEGDDKDGDEVGGSGGRVKTLSDSSDSNPTVKSKSVTANSQDKEDVHMVEGNEKSEEVGEGLGEEVGEDEEEGEGVNDIAANGIASSSLSTSTSTSTSTPTCSLKNTPNPSKSTASSTGKGTMHVVSLKSSNASDVVDLTDDVIEVPKRSRNGEGNDMEIVTNSKFPSRRTPLKAGNGVKRNGVVGAEIVSDEKEKVTKGVRADGVSTSPATDSTTAGNKNIISLDEAEDFNDDFCDVEVDDEVLLRIINSKNKAITSEIESVAGNFNGKTKFRKESIDDDESSVVMDVQVDEDEDVGVDGEEDVEGAVGGEVFCVGQSKDSSGRRSTTSSSTPGSDANPAFFKSNTDDDVEAIIVRKSNRLNGGSEKDEDKDKNKDKGSKKKKSKIGRLKQRGVAVKDKSGKGGVLSNSSDSDDYDDYDDFDDFDTLNSDDDEKAREKKIPKKGAGNISKNVPRRDSARASDSDDDFELDDSDVEVVKSPTQNNNNNNNSYNNSSSSSSKTPRNELEERINADWERSRGKSQSQSQASINFFAPRGSLGSSSQSKKPLKLSLETKQSDQEIKRLQRDKRAFKFFEGTNGTCSTHVLIHINKIQTHMYIQIDSCVHASRVQV